MMKPLAPLAALAMLLFANGEVAAGIPAAALAITLLIHTIRQ